MFDNFEIAERLCPVALEEQPRPAGVAAYRDLLPIFSTTCRVLEPVFDRLADLQTGLARLEPDEGSA